MPEPSSVWASPVWLRYALLCGPRAGWTAPISGLPNLNTSIPDELKPFGINEMIATTVLAMHDQHLSHSAILNELIACCRYADLQATGLHQIGSFGAARQPRS